MILRLLSLILYLLPDGTTHPFFNDFRSSSFVVDGTVCREVVAEQVPESAVWYMKDSVYVVSEYYNGCRVIR